jgi:colanic acid/amylovoran biosynthesis glycosyltransferase
MRVLHLWDNYAPGLFDHSLQICHEEGIAASLVCMNLIEGRSGVPGEVRFLRKAHEDGRSGFVARLGRKLRARLDEGHFRRAFEAEVRRFRPDILHVHYGTTGAILATTTAIRRMPFVISFYGFDISQGLRTPGIRSAYRQLFRLRPLVHVLCDEARDRAIALGANPERIVDANLPLPIDRYPDIGVDGPRVSRWLIPARFVEKKGHEVLLRAFKAHLVNHPDDRLTCWGYGDSARLETRVGELGLSDRVAIVNNHGQGDFDEAYIAQLREHDVILAPSVRSTRGDDEGGPALTAVLAQVAGKPVIVSDFPGHERSVADGVEGLVVPQGDAAALADAMTKLAADPALARRMGQAGRKRAIHEFDRSAYRDALLGWYELLKAGRST